MLHVANCVDFMAGMQPESVDLTITSPPYDNLRAYNGYEFDFEAIAKGLFRITKQGGVVVWVVNDGTVDGEETGTSFRQALYFKDIGFRLFDTMIFAKPVLHRADHTRYYPCFEYMFVFSKHKPKTINLIEDRKNKSYDGKLRKAKLKLRDHNDAEHFVWGHKEYGRRGNIWKYTVAYGGSTKDKIAFQHPAIFPEKLAQDHIISWSKEGDLVFDPMCGSGTVGKMALIHGRKFIGVDISAEYIEIAKERLQAQQLKFVL